jgi:hypothetical protein
MNLQLLMRLLKTNSFAKRLPPGQRLKGQQNACCSYANDYFNQPPGAGFKSDSFILLANM